MASISPEGVLYYESEFNSAEASVDNFIGLVVNIYYGHLTEEVIGMMEPQKLIAGALSPEGDSLTIGPMQGQFRISWMTCDGDCKGRVPTRN